MNNPLLKTYSNIKWINSRIKCLIGNKNSALSASEIKILSSQKPQEIDAQETDRLNMLVVKKKEEHVCVRILRSIIYSLKMTF